MEKKHKAKVIPDNEQNKNFETRDKKYDNLNSSLIDGINCDVNPEQLHKEKQELDKRYQKEIERLQHEKEEHFQVYEKKIVEIKNKEQYKEDLLNNNIQKLREEKELQDKLFEDRIREVEKEKIQQDKFYEEKFARLKQEMNNSDEGLQGIFSKVRQEQSVQMELIDDRIQQLQQEKKRQDELYHMQLEKIEQDKRYKENVQKIKHTTEEEDLMHRERQAQLRKEREHKERSFTESFKNEHAAALQRLKDMEDFTVADDDPDVRGWTVKGSNGETIGKVDELIVDTQSMKVRYLDIDLDNNLLDGDKERHLLIPIGVAKIDDEHDDVLVPTLDGNMARKIPSYSGKEVTRDYEQTLLTTLSPEYNTALHQNESFYENKHFDDSKFYRSKKRK